VYNVVVTNPDSTTSTLPNAFTVSLGGAPQLYTSIVGTTGAVGGLTSAHILQGGTRTMTIIVGNNGTADAYAVPVTAEIGPGVTFSLQNTLLTPAQNPGAQVIDYSKVGISASDRTNTYIGLVIPWIPAGGISHFRLTLNASSSAPLGSSTPISIILGNPYLVVNPNGAPISGSMG